MIYIFIAEHFGVYLLEGRRWIGMCKSQLSTSKSLFITCHIMLSRVSHSTTSPLIKLPDFTSCFLPVNLHYLRLPLQLKAVTSGAM